MRSSQTRARTRIPCIGRWILNHCATREVLEFLSLRKNVMVYHEASAFWHQLYFDLVIFLRFLMKLTGKYLLFNYKKKEISSDNWSFFSLALFNILMPFFVFHIITSIPQLTSFPRLPTENRLKSGLLITRFKFKTKLVYSMICWILGLASSPSVHFFSAENSAWHIVRCSVNIY